MKNKYLTVWVIPLLLLGASCKKQDSIILEKKSKLLNKTDLIGNWIPFKIVSGITDKSRTFIISDTSENVKNYLSSYNITTDYLITNYKKSTYNLSISNNQTFLEYSIFDVTQKFPVLNIKDNVMSIQRTEIVGAIQKVDTIYYKK